MAAEEHAQTPGEYIIHHLTHLGTGKPKGLIDFSVVNFDSVIFSVLLGVVACWLHQASTTPTPRSLLSRRTSSTPTSPAP